MKNHNRTSTEDIELVETANVVRSLRRLDKAAGYGADDRRKRAIYHAVCMTDSFTHQERVNLRVALNLP